MYNASNKTINIFISKSEKNTQIVDKSENKTSQTFSVTK